MEKSFGSFLLPVLLLLHYVTVSSAMTQTNITTDQLALLSLKCQIISDPFTSWIKAGLPLSVCHWVGVTCGSRHQRVESLNLSSMALIGRIPRDFGNLSFLVSLHLGSNNFLGYLPQEIAQLHRLKFLNLNLNNFSGKVPSWFCFLHQLQVLNLGNNSFTGSIPSSFSNISTLETFESKLQFHRRSNPKSDWKSYKPESVKLEGE
ncbi:putative LRR receptor-like serine/threonine-protein kinase-like [Capsicum annuum]|nr:putative LRR receptor-like serine/threonine-protein kinase-like [Capsicum annuum]